MDESATRRESRDTKPGKVGHSTSFDHSIDHLARRKRGKNLTSRRLSISNSKKKQKKKQKKQKTEEGKNHGRAGRENLVAIPLEVTLRRPEQL